MSPINCSWVVSNCGSNRLSSPKISSTSPPIHWRRSRGFGSFGYWRSIVVGGPGWGQTTARPIANPLATEHHGHLFRFPGARIPAQIIRIPKLLFSRSIGQGSRQAHYNKHAVLTHIKSLPRFQRLKSVEVYKPGIYLSEWLMQEVGMDTEPGQDG